MSWDNMISTYLNKGINCSKMLKKTLSLLEKNDDSCLNDLYLVLAFEYFNLVPFKHDLVTLQKILDISIKYKLDIGTNILKKLFSILGKNNQIDLSHKLLLNNTDDIDSKEKYENAINKKSKINLADLVI